MVVFKLIVSFSLNNCFSYRKVFQNGVNALSKMVFEKRVFLSKNSKFCVVIRGPYDVVQISLACGTNIL